MERLVVQQWVAPMSDKVDDARDTGRQGRGLLAAEPTAKPRFSLRSLFYATMAICILLAVLVTVIRTARLTLQRMECATNIKQIALALHNYHDVHRKFPSAITYAADGTPMHSWRLSILPFMEANTLPSYNFGEPWNGPTNCRFLGGTPVTRQGTDGTVCPSTPCLPVYRCPSAAQTQDPTCTNYVMLIDDQPGKPNGPPHRPGSVPPSIDDKSAVIVIEIADSDIHWLEPRDVLLSELSMKINDRSQRSLSSYHGGACVAHADGTVELLDDARTEQRVRELLTE
jgi:hypothetical protein